MFNIRPRMLLPPLSRRVVLLVLLATSACSRADSPPAPQPGQAPPGSSSAADADGGSAPPAATAACVPAPLLLYTETVLPGETAAFADLGTKIQSIQQKFHDDKGAPVSRGFHAKSHACVQAEVQVLDMSWLVDPECKALPATCPDAEHACSLGVFAAPKPYKAWVRLSNGLGYSQADSSADVRGMALKLMGVPDKKVLPGEEDATTQDFLMTNAPTALTDTAQEFMDFAQATTGTASLAAYLASHPTTALRLNARTNRTIASMLDEQFWSGSPYRLGRRAVKLTARPHSPSGKPPPSSPADGYLRDDVVTTLANGDVVFDLLAQVQLDEQNQPIERPTVEWKEADSAFHPVARIVIHKQDLTSASNVKAEAFCNALSFTPWHSLPENAPLGGLNRGRKAVYLASRTYRQAAAEPTGNESF